MIATALLLAAVSPLACGAVTRPGVAERGDDGVWRGSAVEACRRVAVATGGARAAIVFHAYDTLATLHRAGEDRIAFVSPAELDAARLVAGPVVATERQVLVVAATSRVHTARDLADRMVCFIVGTRAEDALDAWAAATATPIERLGFQEEVEMADAFAVGKCAAIAIDERDMRPDAARILPEPLATTPIVAATPVADPAWTRRVAAILADQAKMSASLSPAGPSFQSRSST